jgi:AcrR family transcriptional regulator
MTYAPERSSDPRWRRLPEERPRQILAAAMAIFAEHGIAAAKLEDIAARAGVSKGTIYLYFQSKEDLFREVVRQTVVPLIAQADEIPSDGPASGQLTRYLAHQWECLGLDGADGWVRLVLLELHKFPDLAEFYQAEVIERSQRVLGDILRRGVKSGEFRAFDPPAACAIIKAIILMHVLYGGARSPVPALRAKPRAQILQEITDFVLHALRATDRDLIAPESGVSPA